MNLNYFRKIARYIHFKKLCAYGKCHCFDAVHEEIEILERLQRFNRKSFKEIHIENKA